MDFFVQKRPLKKTKNLNKVGYKILLDIIYSSDSSIKIVDVDINFKTRKTGHSKMNLMVLIKLLYVIILKFLKI